MTPRPFELGVYSFGNTPRRPDGGYEPTAQAVRNVLEAVRVAEEVGLDFFGFGEHHTNSMPLSSPTSLVTAAAASTHTIKLGTTVTVLSTDEPIRVYQQLATAAAIAPGRIDVVAGSGSSAITFPIFDLDERDYDMLYSSKLELLLALNDDERVTWNGPHRRRPLESTLIVRRPEQPLKIWLGTGGSPDSVMRAVELGLPMFLGILGGTPQHWAQYGRAYREAWAEVGNPADNADIAVAVHGFVAEHDRQARDLYLEHELRMFATGSAETGRPAMAPVGRKAAYGPNGMVFVGGPNEVADRILHLHGQLGHSRQISRWTSADSRTPRSSRPSSCSAPKWPPRSERSSSSDDHRPTSPRDRVRRQRQHVTPMSSTSSSAPATPSPRTWEPRQAHSHPPRTSPSSKGSSTTQTRWPERSRVPTRR